MRIDPATGRPPGGSTRPAKLSAGVGADATLVVVGTDKGDVLAFDADGKALWHAQVSSEVMSPPNVAEGIVAVWSGRRPRSTALAAADGKTKWVYQRATRR